MAFDKAFLQFLVHACTHRLMIQWSALHDTRPMSLLRTLQVILHPENVSGEFNLEAMYMSYKYKPTHQGGATHNIYSELLIALEQECLQLFECNVIILYDYELRHVMHSD